jgi:hypothetical protein
VQEHDGLNTLVLSGAGSDLSSLGSYDFVYQQLPSTVREGTICVRSTLCIPLKPSVPVSTIRSPCGVNLPCQRTPTSHLLREDAAPAMTRDLSSAAIAQHMKLHAPPTWSGYDVLATSLRSRQRPRAAEVRLRGGTQRLCFSDSVRARLHLPYGRRPRVRRSHRGKRVM